LLTPPTILWTGARDATSVACSIHSSCAGIELHVTEGTFVLKREMYPDRSTAYERARTLRDAYGKAGYAIYLTI
jgi:hypothetical protein